VIPAKAAGNEPIDAVYMWSGGDELRFALRSLARHAPWVRKVYVVTSGAGPAWIRPGNPRVSVVRHEDLFRGREASPAADPNAVAWQLYRIPGISRQFLSLDHNFLLGRRLAAQDFVTPKGGNRFFVEDADLPPGSMAETLLNARFGNRSPRKQPAHTPRFLDRSFLEEVNRLWEKQIKQGGVSLENLYFYYLVECPQQYGVHERVVINSEIYRVARLSDAKQLAGVLLARPRFVRLEGEEPGMMTRMLLRLYYWRRSPFEK